MWWTPKGERVLRGSEWDLFCVGISTVWDIVEDTFDDPDLLKTRVKAFDDLQPNQKLALLGLVGKALRDEEEPSPNLTVYTEGTVAAVFRHIAAEVTMEIEMAGDLDPDADATLLRRLVLSAALEIDILDEAEDQDSAAVVNRSEDDADEEDEDSKPWSPPDVSSEDVDEWEFVVECLANRILWEDEDFEIGDKFLDADPRWKRAMLTKLNILEDYYVEIAPDPTDAELGPIRRTLRSLCGRAEPKELETFDGLRDTYHELFVGPCDADSVARETACRLIVEIGVIGEDGFDCSLAQWAELFRQDVLNAADSLPSGTQGKLPEPSPLQLMEAARAEQDKKPLLLDDDHRIELRESGWIIVDRYGSALIEVDDPSWGAEGEEDMPPLSFATPKEALMAYFRSEAIAAARSERYEQALKRLGRE